MKKIEFEKIEEVDKLVKMVEKDPKVLDEFSDEEMALLIEYLTAYNIELKAKKGEK